MELENTIQIDAPPEVVWAVTVDIERWPEWTPSVESVKRTSPGEFDVGSTALLKQPGVPEATWTVTSLIEGERFTWESRARGVHTIATHQLTATATGTQSVLRIEMSGLGARLLWPLIRSRVTAFLEQENAGLKRRSESLASSG